MSNLLTPKDVKTYEKASRAIVGSLQSKTPNTPLFSPEFKDFVSFVGGYNSFHEETLNTIKQLYEKFDCRTTCKALNDLRIHKDQLDFSQKALGLEEITILSICPEGQRGFFPLATMLGVTPEFNRLYIHGQPSKRVYSIPKQTSYLQKNLGLRPDVSQHIKDGLGGWNYFSFPQVGADPLAAVYVLLKGRS